MEIASKQRLVLPEYFERYCARGHIVRADAAVTNRNRPTTKRISRIIAIKRPPIQQVDAAKQPARRVMAVRNTGDAAKTSKTLQRRGRPASPPNQAAPGPMRQVASAEVQSALPVGEPPTQPVRPKQRFNVVKAPADRPSQRAIIGQKLNVDANVILAAALANNHVYPISNNIGVGIMSYNRAATLARLIKSIDKYTDLATTTVFISDDGSDDPETIALLERLAVRPDLVVLRNERRLGVAGNGNRLLRCLERFRYFLILNDDVSVLANGWDTFYVDAMKRSGLKHCCFRQPGIYGATVGRDVDVGGVRCTIVDDRPHGAVLAFERAAIERAGYFDEGYGLYGMEHVDLSRRIAAFGVQPAGYYDIGGSASYFEVHDERSAVADRTRLYEQAKQRFIAAADKAVSYVLPSDNSAVPGLSVVIPYRGADRREAVGTVLNNLRALRWPVVQLIVVEHDGRRGNFDDVQPLDHHYLDGSGRPFIKAKAFNAGVAAAAHSTILLHDADILVRDDYAKAIAAQLAAGVDGGHLGHAVIYLDAANSAATIAAGGLSRAVTADHVVGYFEGGSLFCTRTAYWRAGGFNEDFVGYGNEDCEFYGRIAAVLGSRWQSQRTADFLHLWHARDTEWATQHERNKRYYFELMSKPMSTIVADQHAQMIRAGYGAMITEATG